MSVFRNLSFLFNAQVVYRYITIYLSSVLFVDIQDVYYHLSFCKIKTPKYSGLKKTEICFSLMKRFRGK